MAAQERAARQTAAAGLVAPVAMRLNVEKERRAAVPMEMEGRYSSCG